MLNRFRMILVFTLKRIASQPGLALAALAGLTIAAALAMSISIYVDAVYYRAFVEKLSQAEESRPPFTFGLSYTSGSDATWEEVQRVDSYLQGGGASAELGLSTKFIVEQFKTGTYGLYPRGVAQFNAETLVGRMRFGYINGMNDHITLLEGNLPVESTAADSPIEALVTPKTAADFDLQAGENFTLVLSNAMQIPVRIAGIWQANDPNEDFWFTAPTVLYDFLLISKADFEQRIAPLLPGNAYVGEWYMVMNGDQVDYSAAVGLIANINRFENLIRTAFSGLRLMISPRIELQQYVTDAQVLTVQLYAFGLPIIGLLLAFISLTAALAIEGRRNEIAMLRSRGATLSQMVSAAIFEAILLGAAALIIAIPLSLFLAGLIGRSRSFLDFSSEASLRLMPTTPALIFGILVLALAIIAQVVPTIGAARFTVTTYKHNRSRLARRPWWQRVWLDVLLFIPAAYGGYNMAQEGTMSRNPFENPLLFLVPALGILALTLFVLRLLPIFIRIIAWITAQTRSVSILMAARRFARAPGAYTMPLILLVLTLSLSAFTAALAETLNHHLNDAAYYKSGADAKFLDFGTRLDTPDLASRYTFFPTAQYLGPNAYTAARVGQYTSRIVISGGTFTGRFLGVDRYEFPQVAFWRSDFASKDLGTLMNALAANPDSALAPRAFMAANALTIGDRITVTVESRNDGIRLDVPLTIVGDFDLFPTWYPSEGPLFVGNLDYLFERAGGDFPYHVWFDASPEFRRNQINVTSQHIALTSPQYEIDVEERRPERQGLFGLLSVGFLGAAVLTAVGFLLYVLFSFRQRFIEIGMLRAIGLSMRQLAVLLIAELASVILTGALIGTILGVLASLFFIPYLQVDSGVPPFVVEISWPAVLRIYILFSWLFAIALGALAFALRRMKLFQAIKMGETV